MLDICFIIPRWNINTLFILMKEQPEKTLTFKIFNQILLLNR